MKFSISWLKTYLQYSENIDVVLVAPKGAGMTVRNEFLKREGDKLFLEYLENLRSWYDVTKKQTS